MKEVKQMAAQGDVIFRKIKKLPANVAPRKCEGRPVVAHSETGHHHTVDSGVTVYEFADKPDPLLCFLQMNDTVDFTDVLHHRPYDTHETLRLLGKPGDVWEVRKQREHTPEGWRRVAD